MESQSHFAPCDDCPLYNETKLNGGKPVVFPETAHIDTYDIKVDCELAKTYLDNLFEIPPPNHKDLVPILDGIMNSLPYYFLKKWVMEGYEDNFREKRGIKVVDVQGCGGSMTLVSR